MEKKEMNTSKFQKLAIKYLSGDCTQDEIKYFKSLMNTKASYQNIFNEIQQIWTSVERNNIDWDVQTAKERVFNELGLNEKTTKQLIPRIITQPSQFYFGRLFSNAGFRFTQAFLLIAALTVIYFTFLKSDLVEFSASPGQIETVQLADGSEINLDAGSSIKYSEKFNDSEREIFLNGEAYFKVARNENLPFTIYTENAIIEVLGTEFNVKAWESNNNVRVAVKNGRVSFSSINKEHEVFLEKNQMSFLDEYGKPSLPKAVIIDHELGWINRDIHVDNVPLGDLLGMLGRWYDYSYSFTDTTITSRLITMHIINKSPEFILESISESLDLDYYKENQKITFLPKHGKN